MHIKRTGLQLLRLMKYTPNLKRIAKTKIGIVMCFEHKSLQLFQNNKKKKLGLLTVP